MKTKIYIAAPFQLQDAAMALCQILEADDVVCVSRWLTAPENLEDRWARSDLADVRDCDVFIALNPADWATRGTGGRHVEMGYALGLGKPIVLLGQRTNIFHYLTDIQTASVEDVLDIVRSISRQQLQAADPRRI